MSQQLWISLADYDLIQDTSWSKQIGDPDGPPMDEGIRLRVQSGEEILILHTPTNGVVRSRIYARHATDLSEE